MSAISAVHSDWICIKNYQLSLRLIVLLSDDLRNEKNCKIVCNAQLFKVLWYYLYSKCEIFFSILIQSVLGLAIIYKCFVFLAIFNRPVLPVVWYQNINCQVSSVNYAFASFIPNACKPKL